MRKVLVMPDGNWLSHVSRTLEVAKALLELGGYEIVFAGDGEYMRLPRECGFEVRHILTHDADHVMRCSRSGRANWWDYPTLAAHVEADLEIFKQEKPDLVLGDFRLSLSTSCELAEIPLAVILNAAWTDYYSARVRAPEHLWVTRALGRWLTTRLFPLVKNAILRLDSRPFRKYRQEHGLSPRHNIWDVWRGDLNLIVDTPDYGPTEKLPDSFKYIGPIVWEPDIPPPPWLDRLDPERPTIYFTMGSTGFPHFFELAVDLFGGSEYQGVMTTAGMTQFNTLPDNFFVVDYAPGSVLMKQSDVVVCQGGNGTIYQALGHGVPIIGIPTMHDQEFNLDRVVALGAGIHLSELQFRPEHLKQAVEKILSDDRYRESAQLQQENLRHFNGPRSGARAIDIFMNTRVDTE